MPVDPPKNAPGSGAARLIGAVVGFAFAGIGLTVLFFMWAAPSGGFDSPPLFFRIFASFIAIVFVAIGGTLGVAALRGGGEFAAPARFFPNASPVSTPPPATPTGATTGYKCPQCGA